MTKKKTVIIGVGNPLRRDDGIGPAIVKILHEQNKINCDIIDGGTDSFTLLDILGDYQYAVIIDAVNMGAHPGTVRLFSPQEAKIKITADALSTHGFGIAELLQFTEKLQIKTEISIIGVQPESVAFGEGLSKSVEDKISEIIGLISNE